MRTRLHRRTWLSRHLRVPRRPWALRPTLHRRSTTVVTARPLRHTLLHRLRSTSPRLDTLPPALATPQRPPPSHPPHPGTVLNLPPSVLRPPGTRLRVRRSPQLPLGTRRLVSSWHTL